MGDGYLDIVARLEREVTTDSISDAVGLGLDMDEDKAQIVDAADEADSADVLTEATKHFAQWAVLDEDTRAPCGAGCLRPCGNGADRFAELPMRLAPNSSVEVTLLVFYYS